MIGSVLANSLVLAADTGAGGGIFQFLILFAPLFLIWYFLVILPQQRQRRKTQEMLANLKTGDRVITSGGVLGTVVSFRDNVVQLQVAKQVQLDVARSAITGLQAADAAGKKESGGKGKK